MDAGGLLCSGTVFLAFFPIHALAPVRMDVTGARQQNRSFHVGPVFFAFAALTYFIKHILYFMKYVDSSMLKCYLALKRTSLH
jgi:hypothetical protein